VKAAVVIPAYNEAQTIRAIAQGALRWTRFVIVVDDGSADATAAALDGLPITLLRNPENGGKAASLARGFAHALDRGADAVVTLDGDGQHRPEDVPLLLAEHERNPRAFVVASRLHDDANFPRDRYLANRFANFWIAWAAGQPIADSQSGFRVYPASLLKDVKPRSNRANGFVFESEVLIEAGRRGYMIRAVPVPAIYEPRGRRSHFRPILDIARIARMVAWKLLSRGLYPQGLVRSLLPDREARRYEAQSHERGAARGP
jgi:glycosyltransferase involved in cell wall biosynthesis